MKMKTNRRSQISIAVAAALTVPTGQAYAQQDAGTPGGNQLEEIIVTATKREQSVQDIPFNISAISGESLREANLYNISRLAQEVPGLNVVDFGPDNSRVVILRGLNASRIQSRANDGQAGIAATTSIYMNDTLIDYSNLDIVDVARVEVLRGPQGTLYGGGAVGGTIRYVTNAPDPSVTNGWLETGATSTDSHSNATRGNAAGVLNLPLVPDKLALRLYAGYRDVPGYITKIGHPDRPALPPVHKEDQNTSNRFNARAALRWILNDRVEATAAYNGQRLNTKGGSSSTPGLGDPFTGAGGFFPESTDERVDLGTLDLVGDLGFARLTSNSAYFTERSNRVQDETQFLLELSESAGLGYEQFPQFAMRRTIGIDRRRFTQELRLVSARERFLNYVAGAFYLHENTNSYGGNEQVPGLAQFFNPATQRPDDYEFLALTTSQRANWAAFSELTFDFTDRWKVLLGGRYFGYDRKGRADTAFPIFEEFLDSVGTPGCSPAAPGPDPNRFTCTVGHSNNNARGTDFVYKANTSYQLPNADALLFFTVSEGFREGGGNGVNSVQAATVDPRFLTFQPDKATTYELGIKSMWFDKRLRLNASAYHIDWRNIQLQTRVGAGFPAVVNGNSAKIDGIELEMLARVTDSWQLELNLNQLNPRLAEDTSATPQIDGHRGDRLPGSAKTQADFALRYMTAVGNAMDLWLRLGGSYSGDITTQLNDDQFNRLLPGQVLSDNRFFKRLPGYTVWELSGGLSKDHWNVSAYADNLFNKAYIVASSTFELGPVEVPAARQDFYARPRTIGLTVRYQF